MPTFTRAHAKSLLAWGANAFGQLGLDNPRNYSLPEKVNLKDFLPSEVKQICGGAYFTLILTQDGQIYGSGLNNIFQLCSEDCELSSFEVIPTENYVIEQISLTQETCFALTNSGKVLGWGSNSHGQLAEDPFELVCSRRPMEIFGSEENHPVQVAAGAKHCLVLTKNGLVFACGDGKYGQLGKPSDFHQNDFILVENLKDARQIAAGQHHNLARTKENKLFAWGWNGHGQCGSEPEKDLESQVQLTEIVLPVPVENKFKIFCGWRNSAVLLGNGNLFIWGDNQTGQLGLEASTHHVGAPTKVEALSEFVQDVTMGMGYVLVLLKSGEMVAWGDNEQGTCGVGNFEKRVIFPLTTRVGLADTPINIFSGHKQCFVLAR